MNGTNDYNTSDGYTSSCFLSQQCLQAEGLLSYACTYRNIHGYLSLVLCCFGVPTNIVNIYILTRKSLRSPVNNILTGIAITDALTMLTYIPFAVHFYISYGLDIEKCKYTYGWSLFLAFHACLTITTQTISIWLGVCMSFFRYVYIKSMGIGRRNIDEKKSWLLVLFVIILSVAIYIPLYKDIEIHKKHCEYDNSSLTYYRMESSIKLGAKNMTTTDIISVCIYVIIGKWIPCFLIALFGGFLLHSLRDNSKLTKRLNGANADTRHKHNKRTTIMLLTIILMYIIASFPQSVLLLVGFVVEDFFTDEYASLADSIDIIALVNNSTNFVLYCAMSRQFRDLLCQKTCHRFTWSKPKIDYLAVKSTQTASHHLSTNNLQSRLYAVHELIRLDNVQI